MTTDDRFSWNYKPKAQRLEPVTLTPPLWTLTKNGHSATAHAKAPVGHGGVSRLLPEVLDQHQIGTVVDESVVEDRRAIWRHGKTHRPVQRRIPLQPAKYPISTGGRVQEVNGRSSIRSTFDVIDPLRLTRKGRRVGTLHELAGWTSCQRHDHHREVATPLVRRSSRPPIRYQSGQCLRELSALPFPR